MNIFSTNIQPDTSPIRIRTPFHSGLENPCIHEVLEIEVGKIGLDDFALFFQHGGHDVANVVVEDDLSNHINILITPSDLRFNDHVRTMNDLSIFLLFASQLFNQVIYDIGITHEMEAKVWVVKHLADIGIIV